MTGWLPIIFIVRWSRFIGVSNFWDLVLPVSPLLVGGRIANGE